VLLGNLFVGPALRPVEFQHQVAARAAQLINPVLITVQGKEPAIDIEANGGGRIQHDVG
jgi:hypothetical protein